MELGRWGLKFRLHLREPVRRLVLHRWMLPMHLRYAFAAEKKFLYPRHRRLVSVALGPCRADGLRARRLEMFDRDRPF